MSGTNYIRQSTFTDGDIITAALFNNEYNQIQNAFVYAATGTTGHRHDGTSGQGGNIHTIGDQDFDNKIVVDSTNNRWGFFVSVGDEPVEQIRIQDGAIVPVTDNDIDLGTSSLEFKDLYLDGTAYVDSISFNGTVISATAAELNTLDGITSTVAELNILDGVTATAFELNTLDGITSTVAELNILDGVTATASELNTLDGITATVAELNVLDGVTATAAELNYIDGVTSSVQTQLNAKQPLDAQLTDIAGLTPTDGNFIVGNGTNFITETPATALVSLGVTATATELNVLDGVTATTTEINYLDGVTSSIQTQINGLQGSDQSLIDISGISHSDGVFIVSDGTNWIGESGNTAIASLGITSTATELNLLDGATVTTTEINYLDGVTSNIQTQINALQTGDTDLEAIAALNPSDSVFIVGDGSTWVAETGATARASLGLTIGTDVLAYDSNLQSFVTTFTIPTTDGTSGQALLTDGAGNIAFGDVDALPTQTGNSGYFLTTDGTNPSWAEVDALPSQTGESGKYLTTNGTVASWDSIAQVAYTRYNYTATASQAVFGATYSAGYVDVFLNGLKLLSGTDFTAANGTTVTLATGATVNDIVEILAYSTASIVSQVKNPDGGSANSVYTAPQSINGGTA